MTIISTGKLPTYDEEVAVRNQTDAMTPGWLATATFPYAGHQCHRWPALSQADRMVMLNTVASWATIISAVPVAIAASVFLFRTVPTAIRQPKGLRLGLESAIGDPGCCVHITNYGPVEHYISRVGAMPARLRPRWSVCTRRINPKGDLRGPLLVETASANIDRTIKPGRHRSFLVPQQFPPGKKLRDYELESQRVVIERYNSWLKKDRPGGPLPLVPYVLLGNGSVVLGKKTRISGKQPAAIVPLCKCGHSITQHVSHKRKRLAPTMLTYRHCEECWCLWFRQSDKQSDANKIISSTIALKAATFPHKSRIIEESVIGDAVEDIAKTDSPPTHNASSRQSATDLKESR